MSQCDEMFSLNLMPVYDDILAELSIYFQLKSLQTYCDHFGRILELTYHKFTAC